MKRLSFVPDGVPTEPTAPEAFFNRRDFMKLASAGVLMGCAREGTAFMQDDLSEEDIVKPPLERKEVFPPKRNPKFEIPSSVDKKTTERLVAATHNNFYEFLPGRGGFVWPYTKKFEVDPWKIEVSGECHKPQTIDLDALFSFDHEERLYHFRCVERWAMNVPWSGFPLKKLLEKVEPKSEAKYVRFVSAERPNQMPGLASPGYPWPYFEALRIDEAMNELALVVTGAYGEPLLKQHGAPVRIIVPWKYGYKSPKSIVSIELTKEQPGTFWSAGSYAHEYGFLSNVNPNLPHPRWSQQQSYWLESRERFDTPIFNGYGAYVADLYPDEPKTPQKALKRGDIAR